MTDNGDTLVRAARLDRLAAVLGGGLSEALAARLQAADRLHSRIEQVLAARLGAVEKPDTVQARLLGMDAPSLVRLAGEAGAVWHAAAIARLLDGAAVRALVALIGEDLRAAALRGRALAGPATASTPDEIASAIPLDGDACLAAWCEAQPMPVAARVGLRWAPRAATEPSAAHLERGPAIVASLVLG